MINEVCYLYKEVFKRIKNQLIEAHNSDIKYNKSLTKDLDKQKFYRLINKIDKKYKPDDVVENLKNRDIEFLNILIDSKLDVYDFTKIVLHALILNKKINIIKKNKKDFFVFTMILHVSNLIGFQFGAGVDLLKMSVKLGNKEKYDYKLKKNARKILIYNKNNVKIN